jgi:hypothetical protein
MCIGHASCGINENLYLRFFVKMVQRVRSVEVDGISSQRVSNHMDSEQDIIPARMYYVESAFHHGQP